jgi:hypothetical protein
MKFLRNLQLHRQSLLAITVSVSQYIACTSTMTPNADLCSLDFVVLQTDGDKKIELKPGYYMEHDKDV